MHDPHERHWLAVKQILRYLKSTVNFGLMLHKTTFLHLHAYSDADQAWYPDDSQSTSGYCVSLGSNIVSRSARKQKTVFRSSTKAEYRGVAIATAKLMWIQSILNTQFTLYLCSFCVFRG